MCIELAIKECLNLVSISVSDRIQEASEDGSAAEWHSSCAMDGQLPLHPQDAYCRREVLPWGKAARGSCDVGAVHRPHPLLLLVFMHQVVQRSRPYPSASSRLGGVEGPRSSGIKSCNPEIGFAS